MGFSYYKNIANFEAFWQDKNFSKNLLFLGSEIHHTIITHINDLYFFFQTIQYITRSKVIETETRELSSVSRGKIRFSETDDWKNEKLFVPPLPPTNLRGCHLIRIQYDVFVSRKNI